MAPAMRPSSTLRNLDENKWLSVVVDPSEFSAEVRIRAPCLTCSKWLTCARKNPFGGHLPAGRRVVWRETARALRVN